MSFNNHDADDPQGKRYGQNKATVKTIKADPKLISDGVEPIPVEGEGVNQERLDSMLKVSQMAWNHSVKYYCVKDVKCTKQCNVCKLAEQCNPTPPSANDKLKEIDLKPVSSFREESDERLSANDGRERLGQLFENNFDCYADMLGDKPEEMAMTKEKFIEVVAPLLPTDRSKAEQWISVEDRLPEHENNVLAILDNQLCVMAYFIFTEDGIKQKVWGYCYDNINGDATYDDNYYPTHWMDLPSATATPAQQR